MVGMEAMAQLIWELGAWSRVDLPPLYSGANAAVDYCGDKIVVVGVLLGI